MLDGQIVNALMTEIENQLGLYGIAPADLRVTRSDQPTGQASGAVSGTEKYQVFISPVTSQQIGSGWKRTVSEIKYDQTKAKSYQITCLVDFDYEDPSAFPASDLAQIINDMIQQRDAVRNMRAKGVYLQQCTDVRPAFFVNQSDQYESGPSFDITVIYDSGYTKSVDLIEQEINSNVDRI